MNNKNKDFWKFSLGNTLKLDRSKKATPLKIVVSLLSVVLIFLLIYVFIVVYTVYLLGNSGIE